VRCLTQNLGLLTQPDASLTPSGPGKADCPTTFAPFLGTRPDSFRPRAEAALFARASTPPDSVRTPLPWDMPIQFSGASAAWTRSNFAL
jgi:hypothetical protein